VRKGITLRHQYKADCAVGWMVQGSNPHRGKGFFSSPKHPDWLWAHPASYSMGTGVFSRW